MRCFRSSGVRCEVVVKMPKAEDVDEVEPVDPSAVDPLLDARGYLPRRLERVLRHAERPREVVGRTGGNNPQRHVEPLAFHGVDGEVNRAVTAGDHHQLDLLVPVEGVGVEIDLKRFDVVSVGGEYLADILDLAVSASLAGLRVV